VSQSSINLWGRAWKLTVQIATPPAPVGPFTTPIPQPPKQVVLTQSSWDPEALRLVFDVLQSTLPSPYWFALIKIYNLNDETMQNLLFNAAWVTLEAGYQDGPNKSSIIWDGPVLQVLFDREHVVDKTITFNCIAGPDILEKSFINTSLGINSSQLQAVSKMIAQKSGNVNQQISKKAQEDLRASQLLRGKTFFGQHSKYFGQIAVDNHLNYWINGVQHNLSELYDPAVKVNPDLVYAPPFGPNYQPPSSAANITRSIIGVPRQSTFGVLFTVLLDPRLVVKVPPLLVQLQNTVIQQQKFQVGQLPGILDQNGLVIAAQVHHVGDTRGNDWYTECTGFVRGYCQNLLDGLLAAASQGTLP